MNKHLLRLFCLLIFLSQPSIYWADSTSLSRKEIRLLFRSGTEAMQARKYDEAILFYRNILNSGSTLAEARNNLAVAYMKTDRLEEAVSELHLALEKKPEYPDALNNLASAYLKMKGFHKNALMYASRATQLAPQNSACHDTLGQCYQSLGLFEKARETYHLASLLDIKNVTPILHLGKLLLEMKEKAEAITAFRRVLDVEPNNLDANWHLYRLFTEDNNLNASKFRFERLFKGLADKTAEPELLRKIENTLICYFKSYLTEMAVIISRTENPDATQKDFFINYDRIAGTVIADLIPTDSLFCPDCGKFYTSYINHVSCPVHGYSEILTENITDIKEVRKRYNQEICLRNRYGLILAIAQYRLATGEKHPENFNHLVKEGFLLDIPQCPNGGSFKVDEKGLIRCEIHGELENLRQ